MPLEQRYTKSGTSKMQQLSFNAFMALRVIQPLKLIFDDDDAVVNIQRSSQDYNNWLALPIEWELGLPDTPYTKHLAEYSVAKNVKKIIGFSPRFLTPDSPSEILIGDPTAENFFKIQSIFALRAYTVIPDNGDFQIISDGDYYTIFAGTQKFIFSVLNGNMPEVMRHFKQAIQGYPSGRHEVAHLTKVLKACEDFNASTTP